MGRVAQRRRVPVHICRHASHQGRVEPRTPVPAGVCICRAGLAHARLLDIGGGVARRHGHKVWEDRGEAAEDLAPGSVVLRAECAVEQRGLVEPRQRGVLWDPA